MESAETEQKSTIAVNGFDPDVKYPLVVQYCGGKLLVDSGAKLVEKKGGLEGSLNERVDECSMPLEYCEYSGIADRCRKWLEKNMPSEMERLQLAEGDEVPDAEKKHQKRGGKGSKSVSEKAAAGKKKTGPPAKVTLQRAPRGKNKSVTVIKGLAAFDVDLKAAAKFFAGRFACGSSVTGTDEIVVQGDVKDDLFDIITEKWPNIDEDSIEDVGDQKR